MKSFQLRVDEKRVRELATLGFVERSEVVLFTGLPGVGKTMLAPTSSGLAIALGMEALKAGYSVYFTHHATVINIRGRSCRLREKLQAGALAYLYPGENNRASKKDSRAE